MPCSAPVGLKKKFSEQYPNGVLLVPCGQCGGCLANRARTWSLRCSHELPFHKQSCFVTLTYDPEHLPSNDGIWPSLQPFDVQLFIKRLRKNLGKKWPKIKLVYCGEYGDKLARPHYHLIIFGVDFRDPHPYQVKRKTLFNSVQSMPEPGYYQSSFLTWLWGKGQCVIGPVTPETIAYTCRYTIKKQQNKKLLQPTQYPEFIRVSNGISLRFIEQEKNIEYLLTHDTFNLKNQKYHPPRYYSEYIKKKYPQKHADLIESRLKKMKKQKITNITTLKILNKSKSDRSEQNRKL